MKVTVAREELQGRLSNIQNIVEKKNTMPILNHFLLSAESGKSLITATDLETAFREPIEAGISEPGRMCIPARKLFEIVREIEGDVTLESADGQWLKVKAGSSNFRLACLPEADFPVWPALGEAEEVALTGAVLLEMIDRTLYAAGESDTRYVLNGLLFHLRAEGTMAVVGTDGHRLALSEKAIGSSLAQEKKVIVSRKAIAELRRFLDKEDQGVTLRIGKNHVLFVTGQIEFLTRLIEGTYPNYEQVVPSGNDKTLTVDRASLAKSLRRVSIMSKERSNAVRVDVDSSVLVISASNPDLGEARDEVAASYSGEPMTIAFNARYLLDAINVMRSDTVIVKLREALSAVLITEGEGPDYRCVVMPMRL